MKTNFFASSFNTPFPVKTSPPPRRVKTHRKTVFASKKNSGDYGSDHSKGIVDENMIVLRKRMHEMKMAERNYEPPENWMEWEKRYYTRYESDVCVAIGFLQTFLMNNRPSVGVSVLLLHLLSLPVSVVLILLHLTSHIMPSLG
ncbi:uncharacterized protein LOC120256120 [Dioscorea cayenensis subsp. rotundata]|uniref:Uncharacterized protein LOC120256120 n=1 Tax=Dioscorea cayennensis subsp. rotundata TaxID=55577 RepID=A0AB40AXR2_DIOCR|nr:uncharacterized protein LOC120256120 [Dioscorea cayenensis subsp. rotundata]